jgi:hypothetical protein
VLLGSSAMVRAAMTDHSHALLLPAAVQMGQQYVIHPCHALKVVK